MADSAPPPPSHLSDVDLSSYDFIDLGSSSGGSLAYCTARFCGARGIGVDTAPSKVAAAVAGGVDAVLGDATNLTATKAVRFVSMFDFLEHLPNAEVAAQVIEQAASAATDFLFIRHPSFEGEGLIEASGLRQYWWQWRGHTNHMRVGDFCTIFDRLGLASYRIHFNEAIRSSTHRSLIPTSAPIDSLHYDRELQGPKAVFALPEPIWRSQTIFVQLRSFAVDEWANLTADR